METWAVSSLPDFMLLISLKRISWASLWDMLTHASGPFHLATIYSVLFLLLQALIPSPSVLTHSAPVLQMAPLYLLRATSSLMLSRWKKRKNPWEFYVETVIGKIEKREAIGDLNSDKCRAAFLPGNISKHILLHFLAPFLWNLTAVEVGTFF